MDNFVFVGDIVEENRKTVRENRMKKTHNIPLGTLVEVKFDRRNKDGACSKIHARKFVVAYERDCDGTPLYSLADRPLEKMSIMFSDPLVQVEVDGEPMNFPSGWFRMSYYGYESGFSEESLTPVEITEELLDGVGALEWDDE